MRNASSTYLFDQRSDQRAELARLQAQARLDIEAERAMWKLAGLEPGMKVLDLGCGPGVVSCSLAMEVPEGSVLGMDLSETLLASAEETRGALGIKNLSFARGNVYDLPLEENSFDFVYARFLFQHLSDPAVALQNIFRVLKPGGKLCLLDVDDRFLLLSPEPASFREFQRLAVEAQKAEGGNREIGGALLGLLQAAGFRKVDTLMHVIRSTACGMEAFLDIAVRFKAKRLLARPELTTPGFVVKALKELEELKGVDGAFGALGMFVGVGTKE